MNRRGFLAGVGGILAAPAIVRVASIMPVRALRLIDIGEGRWLRFTPKYTNDFVSFQAIGTREDLTDLIYNVTTVRGRAVGYTIAHRAETEDKA